MSVFLLLAFAFGSGLSSAVEINLTELGFYKPDFVSITKVGNRYLLSAAQPDAAIKIVDQHGLVHATYTKAGRGPEELFSQNILAVSSSKIYVYSMSPAILVFDHELNLLSDSKHVNLFPEMSQLLGLSGFMTSDSEFTIINNVFQEHGALLFNVNDASKGDSWLPYDRQIPKRHLPNIPGDPEVTNAHDSYVFLLRDLMFDNRKEYNVLAHLMIDGVWQPVAELSHHTDDLLTAMEPVHCFIPNVYKTQQGFVVEVISGLEGKKPPEHFQNNFDYFDHNGRFLRRVTKQSLSLRKVLNGSEIFVVEARDDADYLVPFEL